jgi:hypothetical protein
MRKEVREQLYRFLEANPLLEERLMAIVNLSENTDGTCIIADEVEKRLIAEMQQFGNSILTAWATTQEKKLAEHSSLNGHIKHSKKNSIF